MAIGYAGVNIPNLPGINKYGKLLGDASSLQAGTLPLRIVRGRIVGRMAGKTFGFVKANFGVFGLIATAEFMGFLRDLVRYRVSQNKSGGSVWFGSMATYALPTDRGFVSRSGKNIPAAPYFSNALVQANQEMTRRGRRGGIGSGVTAIRSGLYEGQKYIGDFGAFFRGDLSRVARRTSGQEVAGFFWGTFRVTKTGIKGPPDLLAVHAQTVLKHARNNLRKYGKVKTGILQQSLAWGGTQEEFMQESIQRARKRAMQRGLGQRQIEHRIASPSEVPTVEPAQQG